jgi:hypothetical protein
VKLVFVDSKAVLSAEKLGDCYRWATLYVLAHPNAVLYQGTVVAPYSDVGKDRYDHAWVLDGGVVKDWQTMVAGMGGRYTSKGWPQDVWERAWKPRSTKVFTHEQARLAFSRYGHYGPWNG